MPRRRHRIAATAAQAKSRHCAHREFEALVSPLECQREQEATGVEMKKERQIACRTGFFWQLKK